MSFAPTFSRWVRAWNASIRRNLFAVEILRATARATSPVPFGVTLTLGDRRAEVAVTHLADPDTAHADAARLLRAAADHLDPAVAYINDRHALYGETPLWGRDTGIAAHSMALAIRAYAKAVASVEHVDAWDVSRMEHETDVLRDRIRALEEENASLRRDAATELTRHDQAHGHYETATAPTHTHHTE